MNVSGKGMVFKNEHQTNGNTWYSYAIGISSKSMDGEYVSTTMPIRFRKGVDLSDRAKIEITNGFLTVREYEKNGEKRKIVEVMCLDFNYMGEATAPDGYAALVDDDITF